jgi:hypothetical protein
MVVGPKRRGPQVARRAQFEQHGRDALVVGGFDYSDDIVRPYGPVDFFDRRPVLLGKFVSLYTSVDGIPDVPHPLVGPVHQGYLGRHTCSSSFLPPFPAGILYLDSTRKSG